MHSARCTVKTEQMEKLTTDLRPFFEPRSIAIIGARRKPGFGFGLSLFLEKLGFGEKLYLVTPTPGPLHGRPVYAKVDDLPEPVDLGIVIVPAPATPEVLAACGRRGIRHLILENAGFAETGPEGAALEERCRELVRKLGLRVIGPNCVGLVNTRNRFASTQVMLECLAPGAVGIIAQSGVFGNILLDWLPEEGVKISKAVTIGNRLDVNECDLLDYLAEDPETRVIALYLEGAKHGPRLLAALQRATAKKPVVVLKSGRTEAGRRATASHTGSLSGEDEIYDAVFRQAGAIRARSVQEMFDLAQALTTQPRMAGDRVGVVTSSGSLGALVIDACLDQGLRAADLSEETVARVRQGAPAWMNVRNPLDVGPSGQFKVALEAVLKDPGVDGVIAIPVVPFSVMQTFEPLGLTAGLWIGEIGKIWEAAGGNKPLVVIVIGASGWIARIRELCGEQVPVLRAPESAAQALKALLKKRG